MFTSPRAEFLNAAQLRDPGSGFVLELALIVPTARAVHGG